MDFVNNKQFKIDNGFFFEDFCIIFLFDSFSENEYTCRVDNSMKRCFVSPVNRIFPIKKEPAPQHLEAILFPSGRNYKRSIRHLQTLFLFKKMAKTYIPSPLVKYYLVIVSFYCKYSLGCLQEK